MYSGPILNSVTAGGGIVNKISGRNSILRGPNRRLSKHSVELERIPGLFNEFIDTLSYTVKHKAALGVVFRI